MSTIDLHLHTTFSDGTLSPTDVVKLCVRRGLKTIAVTDHDTTDGLPEAISAAEQYGDLRVIRGVELSTDVSDGEIHLLGYFVEHNDAAFQRILLGFRDERKGRALAMVERLDGLGVQVSWERVQELAEGGSIGRPHIAQAMVENGYVRYPKDAFDKYIGRYGPAYVERSRMTPRDAVEALVRNGALPVMAHPIYYMAGTGPQEVAKLKSTLLDLKDAGLVGMEVYYSQFSPEQVALLAAVADDLGLLPCGGSDYHASGNPGEPEPGTAGPPASTLQALNTLRKQRMSA